MEAFNKGEEVPKLPKQKNINQTDMDKWFKDFTLYQKCKGEKWIVYHENGVDVAVAGNWQMVGGSVGPSIQPVQPNYLPIIVPGDALAAVRHSAERQNGEMIKENRKLKEKLASERLVLAELIKDCMEPIIPLLMRTPGGPALFEDPTDPLQILLMIRSFNPHDKELIGNSVRNFYESEGYFKTSYQGMMTAYEFMESKRNQWEHLVCLCNRANSQAADSVIMMSDRERVMVLMSTMHQGYRNIKRRIDLGELPGVNTLEEFTNFINRYEITAAEMRPKPIVQRKIFTVTEGTGTNNHRICKIPGHTPGHQYGGKQCNEECKIKFNNKSKYAEEKRDDVKRMTSKAEE